MAGPLRWPAKGALAGCTDPVRAPNDGHAAGPRPVRRVDKSSLRRFCSYRAGPRRSCPHVLRSGQSGRSHAMSGRPARSGGAPLQRRRRPVRWPAPSHAQLFLPSGFPDLRSSAEHVAAPRHSKNPSCSKTYKISWASDVPSMIRRARKLSPIFKRMQPLFTQNASSSGKSPLVARNPRHANP